MNYSIQQLPSSRWGIYSQQQLIATIGCHQTAVKILLRLQQNNPCPIYPSGISGFNSQPVSTKRVA
ncbi:MAG: hypothetical protein QNJ34_25465 [Xenococcaceae cyanobacterium MO_188.B29]|nr:hypothetical protein [Xenococcaceae cyanobacterium MO_188.B29]